MVSIDDNVQVGLELTTSTMRLSAKAIIAIMDLFLEQDNRKDYYQDLKPNTKQGKQEVKDLFSKYENTEVHALDSNLSKEEIKNIEKELKSMGVDFSIRKIEKDNYSLFFAGKDMEAIEKGMFNAIEKRDIQQKRKTELKEKVSSIGKGKASETKQVTHEKAKENKPSFSINDLQTKHIEKKQKEKEQTKVRNKVPNRSL